MKGLKKRDPKVLEEFEFHFAKGKIKEELIDVCIRAEIGFSDYKILTNTSEIQLKSVNFSLP